MDWRHFTLPGGECIAETRRNLVCPVALLHLGIDECLRVGMLDRDAEYQCTAAVEMHRIGHICQGSGLQRPHT